MSPFVVGQRYVSEAEPELGLGRVERVENRRVVLRFPASDTLREYALVSAPLRRAVFRMGDEIEDGRGRRFRVEEVEERDGLLTYSGDSLRLSESDLAGTLGFSKPEERLLGRLWDPSRVFDLRRRALEHRHEYSRSPALGFLGARIELFPHQLYVAREVASRPLPRALLADEVGLGKTIEAGLVVHRLLKSGQMTRVLVLVPESLVHQWFVEMFRRFHLSFTIADERYCRETETEQGVNPFLHAQTVIASLEFLARDPAQSRRAIEAGWDMLVVDEAHHLAWSEESVSPEYRLAEAIASRTRGVLLLTATPEQLGEEGHFARLRLLDPARYRGYAKYRSEKKRYRTVAAAAEKLLDGSRLTRSESRVLKSIVPPEAKSLRASLDAFVGGDENERAPLLEALVDQHGPGRVVFRNGRKVLAQFPARKLRPWQIDWPEEGEGQQERLARELTAETEGGGGAVADYRLDARTRWLGELLRELSGEKALVICRFKERAVALHEALRQTSTVTAGLFHEELSLLQRDRNAAWFAEPDGARVLLCSEIGSEGRNFQFAHHLVLFDLPPVPELLEQRIGRLYRIGQDHTVEIHVPCLPGSAQEMLLLWYHEGLDAFETSLPSTSAFDDLARRAWDLALRHGETRDRNGDKELPATWKSLVEETRELREKVGRELEAGRDRLLELSSYRPGEAQTLIEEIRSWDEDRRLESFIAEALDYFGVELEEVSPRSFVFRQGARLVVEALPGLRAEEVGMTSDRDRATHQGELDLLSWDHPMVGGVLELLLGGHHGNCAVSFLPGWDLEKSTFLLEAVFVLDTVAPSELFVSRFLPPTPLRVVVDETPADVTGACPVELFEARLVDGRKELRFADLAVLEEKLPPMISKARSLAARAAPSRIEESLSSLRATLDGEIRRLRFLSEINDHVRSEEIARREEELARIEKAIGGARLTLDALRLVLPGSRSRDGVPVIS